MNHDDKNDPAAATPQISPEPNPRLNKALTLVENKPQPAESPPFYNRRKQKRPPKIVTGGGADEARAYVSATTLPPNRDHQSTDMERVQVAAGLDPRQSQTLRSIRTDLIAGAPPPVPEGAFGGSTQPIYTQPQYTGQAAPHALGEAPPEPQDGPPQSSRSRTLGGRTQRILVAGAPEPAGEISASHPRPASSGPSRTVGGRTQRMPVMTPQLIAEEAARMAGAAARSPTLSTSPSNAPPAIAAGREFVRARDAARPAQDPGRRRIIAGIVVMTLTILALGVIALIPRCNQAQLEAQNLAATGMAPTRPLSAEAPSPPPAIDPPAPIPTEVAAVATVDPPSTAAPEPSAPLPEPVIPTAAPIAVAPTKKRVPVRPPPPLSTAQSTAGPDEKPPAPPTAPPAPTPAPPDDFILRPKEP
jgi:hypothetical protein